MKKSKILLVTVLALVLCLLCVTTSTFSWLPRPKAYQGNSLSWVPSYETSVGKDITMKTYSMTEDGKEPVDENGKPVLTEVTNFSRSEPGLGKGERVYYRTDIKNSGTEAQSVSLFLSSLSGYDSTGGEFCLGVNGPLRTYKNYSDINSEAGSRVEKVINEQYVYLGLHADEEKDGKLNNIERIHAWNGANIISDCMWRDRLSTGETKSWLIDGRWADEQDFNIYAMKVDYRCTNFKLKERGDGSTGWLGSDPAIANNNTILLYEWNGGHYADAKNSATAAGIKSFYSSAGVNVGKTVDLAAKGHTNTFAYTSSDESVATVDSNGQVKAKKAGHTSIILTSTGAYGDKITAACWLTVHGTAGDTKTLLDVPVATNIKVAPKTEAGDTVVSVYWYIKNEGNEPLKYTIEDIYLTL